MSLSISSLLSRSESSDWTRIYRPLADQNTPSRSLTCLSTSSSSSSRPLRTSSYLVCYTFFLLLPLVVICFTVTDPYRCIARSVFEPRIALGFAEYFRVQRHHQRSLSAVSILAGPAPYNAPVFISPPRSAHVPRPSVPVSIASAALVRPLHSNLHANTFAFTPGAAGDIPPSVYDGLVSRASTSELHSPRASSPEFDDEYDFGHDSDDDSGEYSLGQYYASAGAGGMGYGVEVKAAMDGVPGASRSNALAWTGWRAMLHEPHVAVHGGCTSHRNEVPQECRAEVERIFFEFLRQTCSNLDATESKGESIHQMLMAKNMQRLDESPDFCPFNFRAE
ncbi:hypothetical protein A0H81_12714 [Grifola frondosa]|uniref:Uncharacterized protein n=1 Tax=Grifola frondosa TaxID=5627 RepID=A0A1C7LS79_GRIFR|nr:hypothetical protein A0H81_12714 [Grifola frondosa]